MSSVRVSLSSDFNDSVSEMVDMKDVERFMIQIGDYSACFVSNILVVAEVTDMITSGLRDNTAVNGKEFLSICRMILMDAVNSAIAHNRVLSRSTFDPSSRLKSSVNFFAKAPCTMASSTQAYAEVPVLERPTPTVKNEDLEADYGDEVPVLERPTKEEDQGEVHSAGTSRIDQTSNTFFVYLILHCDFRLCTLKNVEMKNNIIKFLDSPTSDVISPEIRELVSAIRKEIDFYVSDLILHRDDLMNIKLTDKPIEQARKMYDILDASIGGAPNTEKTDYLDFGLAHIFGTLPELLDNPEVSTAIQKIRAATPMGLAMIPDEALISAVQNVMSWSAR